MYKYIICGCEIIVIIYFVLNPVLIPLEINNVLNNNRCRITELLLEADREYEIIIDYENYGNEDVQFVIEKGTVKENILLTYDYMILRNNIVHITADADVEYYLLSINNLKKDTDIVINSVIVNGVGQNINTFFIPYQLSRQLDLTKYDKASVVSRFTYYKDSIKYAKNNYYLWGSGADTFKYYRLKYYDGRYQETNPHSILFQYLLELGILGVVYLLYIYGLGIITMLKKRNFFNMLIWFIFFTVIAMFSMFDLYLSIESLRLLMLLSFIVILDFNNIDFKNTC